MQQQRADRKKHQAVNFMRRIPAAETPKREEIH
jgi:hypothetical protein